MSSAAAGTHPRQRPFVDRLLAVVPIVGLALLVLSFYLVQAWSRKTPWLFTDELEWSQLSRSIAESGHAARRGDPIFFKSVYAYLIAPFWWIDSTHSAYNGIKYFNAVVMTLAAVPTYLLARLLVGRRASLVAALLAVSIPGMSYVTTIVPESLAYTWFALCSWLIVRALTTGRLGDAAVAVAVSASAVLVKSQLELALAAFLIAAVGLWVTGPRGRARRAGWTRGDTLGALVLLVGAMFLFNRVFLDGIETWHVATEYWKSRMIDLGLTAGAALAIGLGFVPVICGFVALRLPERRGQPAYRAFAAYLAVSIVLFSLYTAGKAAYLSTKFATLTEERNLIYLAPLLAVATVLVFGARRIDWRLVAAATAFVLFIVLTKPLQLGYPYFEAPGMSIATLGNRELGWDVSALRWAFLAACAVGVLLLVLRARRGVAVVAAALLLAWMLAGEIEATAGNNDLANGFYDHMDKPLDGVDRLTGGDKVTLLGQFLQNDPNGIWLAEFWNRSIAHVGAIDGTAPGPGPGLAPGLVSNNGELSYYTGDRYVLAGAGVTMQGDLVGKWGGLDLYRLRGQTWKLRDAVQQVYSDGWCPKWCAYTYFGREGPGTLVVEVRRTGYNGDAPPGNVKVTAGTVKLDDHGAPGIGRILAQRKTVIHNLGDVKVRIPLERTPVRVRVDIDPTFHPSPSDTRDLGAQVSFRFEPR